MRLRTNPYRKIKPARMMAAPAIVHDFGTSAQREISPQRQQNRLNQPDGDRLVPGNVLETPAEKQVGEAI